MISERVGTGGRGWGCGKIKVGVPASDENSATVMVPCRDSPRSDEDSMPIQNKQTKLCVDCKHFMFAKKRCNFDEFSSYLFSAVQFLSVWVFCLSVRPVYTLPQQPGSFNKYE